LLGGVCARVAAAAHQVGGLRVSVERAMAVIDDVLAFLRGGLEALRHD
jgi:hypothetical protein